MALPTFLGIGVPRAGSTWMASLLDSHPAVYIAPGKEIFFFNRYHQRGLSWYENLFPPDAEAGRYQAMGEFTPEYLYCELCPERMAAIASITKLILSVRSPIDRTYSHYGLQVRSANYRKSFEDFLTTDVLEMGFYSQKIKNFLNYFERDQMLILVFEQTIAEDIHETKKIIAQFLGLAVDRFPPTAGTTDVNQSYIPKARLAYNLYARAMQMLLKWSQHRLVKSIRQLRLERFFGEAGPLPPMKEETRLYLREIYKDEIEEMESILQVNLTYWK